MPHSPHATLTEWIAREAIPCSLDSAPSLNAAVDRLLAALGKTVEVLAFGEAFHGSNDFLLLRNRIFQHLVAAHSYTAIAIESSFPRGRLVNEYIAGRDEHSLEKVLETGVTHNFGQHAANRELLQWMRAYNADSKPHAPLSFYGFDSPTEMMYTDSPRQLLHFALDYLAEADSSVAEAFRSRIDPLLGEDAPWENQQANFDPAKSIGLSPAAIALRTETDKLIAKLKLRRPEFIAKSDAVRFAEALRYAEHARQLLAYHTIVATPADDRLDRCLSQRDVMMADNLVHILQREQTRAAGPGKVFAFAHNGHLKYGSMQMQLGPHLAKWWPAGAHLRAMLGPRYAVIGAVIGTSETHTIGQPEPGTLEAHLTAQHKQPFFIPTHQGHGLPAAEVAALPARTTSNKNPGYFPFTNESLAEYDSFLVLPQL